MLASTKKKPKSPSRATMVKMPTTACLFMMLNRNRPDFAPLQELLNDRIRRLANLVHGSVRHDRPFEQHGDVVRHQIDALQVVRHHDGGSVETFLELDDRLC